MIDISAGQYHRIFREPEDRKRRGGHRPVTAIGRVALFFAKIQKTDTCWLWTSARLPKGYGIFHAGRYAGRQVTVHAHVVMWRLTHNGRDVPDGLEVMHSCHVPWCVNPAHLSVGTHRQNIEDSRARGAYRRNRPGASMIQRELVTAALSGPHGTIIRLAREHGVSYRALSMAVCRARTEAAA